MKAKERSQATEALRAVPDDEERVIVASGRYLGEPISDINSATRQSNASKASKVESPVDTGALKLDAKTSGRWHAAHPAPRSIAPARTERRTVRVHAGSHRAEPEAARQTCGSPTTPHVHRVGVKFSAFHRVNADAPSGASGERIAAPFAPKGSCVNQRTSNPPFATNRPQAAMDADQSKPDGREPVVGAHVVTR
jgi:hypothetical protein